MDSIVYSLEEEEEKEEEEDGEDGEDGEEEAGFNIKSNNPNLKGGALLGFESPPPFPPPGGPGGFFRIFDFGPLDPLGGPESPSGPTLEKRVFYDFLKISLILRFSSIFHS